MTTCTQPNNTVSRVHITYEPCSVYIKQMHVLMCNAMLINYVSYNLYLVLNYLLQ